MSTVNAIFEAAEEVLLASCHADTAVFLSGKTAGKSFVGRLDVEPAIMFAAILGEDKRESATLRVLPDRFPCYNSVKRGDFLFVEAKIDGGKWSIVDRDLNPVTVLIEFKLKRELQVIKKVFNPNTGQFFLANENGIPITDENGHKIIIS